MTDLWLGLYYGGASSLLLLAFVSSLNSDEKFSTIDVISAFIGIICWPLLVIMIGIDALLKGNANEKEADDHSDDGDEQDWLIPDEEHTAMMNVINACREDDLGKLREALDFYNENYGEESDPCS